ncbi:hypothetical protein Aave_0880 [Paracidovorax citrulli AAC00-1]|uniref:Uncharacterized protein n=1 Tax=Paracidovorax citrulli (strain AAC00-1) TaxID=397945 RepID=A1TKJ0_PARC0|nr:hypothetical protein Aave_0880 [Paracidovorax citrulli AAC00-1]
MLFSSLRATVLFLWNQQVARAGAAHRLPAAQHAAAGLLPSQQCGGKRACLCACSSSGCCCSRKTTIDPWNPYLPPGGCRPNNGLMRQCSAFAGRGPFL